MIAMKNFIHVKEIILFALLAVLSQGTSFAQRSVEDLSKPAYDSSQVVIAVIDTLVDTTIQNGLCAPMIALPPSPIGYALDKTRIVGEVPYQLGTSPSGQVTLNVPIESFATEFESAPLIALSYCSQDEMTLLGNGWSISGLSQVEPVNKNFFTDGNARGRNPVNGPWSLDGNRLILKESDDSVEVYMSQTGNIKVVRYLDGTGFMAYLPDGTKNN